MKKVSKVVSVISALALIISCMGVASVFAETEQTTPTTIKSYLHDGSGAAITGGDVTLTPTSGVKGRVSDDLVYEVTSSAATGKKDNQIAGQWLEGVSKIDNFSFEAEFMFPSAGSRIYYQFCPKLGSDYAYPAFPVEIYSNGNVQVRNFAYNNAYLFEQTEFNDGYCTLGTATLNVWHKIRIILDRTSRKMTVNFDGTEKSFAFNPDGILIDGTAKKAACFVDSRPGYNATFYMDNIRQSTSFEKSTEAEKAEVLTALGDFVYDGNVSGIFKYSGKKITGLRSGAEIQDGVMVIPGVLEDGTVIENVAGNAFASNNNIKKLVLGEGIVSVEIEAFRWCSKLKDIECASTVVWLAGMSFYATGAENVIFKGDISLGNGTFGRCANLKKIVAYGTLTPNATPFSYTSNDTTPKTGVSVYGSKAVAESIKAHENEKWAGWDFYTAYIDEEAKTAYSFEDGATLHQAQYSDEDTLDNVLVTNMTKGVSYPVAFAKSEFGGKVFVWNDMIPLTKSAEFTK